MEEYVCPVCKEALEHDLMVFLKHTDHHIIEEILREHPQWGHQDGICKECLDYYRKNLGHTTFLDDSNGD